MLCEIKEVPMSEILITYDDLQRYDSSIFLEGKSESDSKRRRKISGAAAFLTLQRLFRCEVENPCIVNFEGTYVLLIYLLKSYNFMLKLQAH